MLSSDLTIAHDIIKLQFAFCTVQTNTTLDCPISERPVGMSGRQNPICQLHIISCNVSFVHEWQHSYVGYALAAIHNSLVLITTLSHYMQAKINPNNASLHARSRTNLINSQYFFSLALGFSNKTICSSGLGSSFTISQ